MKISTTNSKSMTRCGLLSGVFAAVLMTSPLFAFENMGRDYEEDSDAGDSPDTSQKVTLDTFDTVKTIKGELKGDQNNALGGDGPPDLQDVYEVVIKDPGVFVIQTIPPQGSTEFDSLLGVYDYAGFALLANEDAKPNSLGSRVGNSTSQGVIVINEPGAIYISISGASSRPVTANGAQVFAFTDDAVDVVGASPAGQESPFAAWGGGSLKEVGNYVIELTAVAPFPSNCGVDNTSSCFEVHPIPYCDNDTCCVAVCTVNPFCCDVTWDASCVAAANFLCSDGEGGCGAEGTESCYEVHESPYCDFAPCCALVCQAIPECCQLNWDAVCAQTAFEVCQDNCNFDCPPDLNFDNIVSGPDLAFMLGSWGQNGCADLNGDGTVSGPDLAILLGQWGFCFQ